MQYIPTKQGFGSIVKSTAYNIITWKWTKTLLYWIIMSAGTMSECAFLIASLWMTLNSSVHKLVLLAVTEQQATHITELATAAYVALPECILALAVVTVITHFRVFLYDRSNSELAWSILYGLPTLVFLVLSMITLGCSVASTSFILPLPLVILRALAGYVFAFTSLLNVYLGEPQVKDKLQKKDDMYVSLQEQYNADVALLMEKSAGIIDELTRDKDAVIASLQERYNADMSLLTEKNTSMIDRLSQDKDAVIARLTEKLESQKAEIENQKQLLQQHKNTEQELINAVKKSDEDALQGYSDDCKKWLNSEVKTASIEEITRYTGIKKSKIEAAITKEQLRLSPRNKDLILMSSLVQWLKTVNLNQRLPLPKTDELPALHIVNR